MNAQEYIDNGSVVDYCLGLMGDAEKAAFEQALETYPELRYEVEAVQWGLEKYASAHSVSPPSRSKDKIWGAIENILLEKEMDLAHLPLINEYSDHKAWFAAMKPLLPKEIKGDQFMKVLTETDKVMQVLVFTRIHIPDEVHSKEYESFMILEGECECHIGSDTVVRVKAGGYQAIPLHEHHDLKIISEYVIGIMQRIAA